MAVEVFAADEQGGAPVDTLRWVRLAEAVLADQGVRGDAELSMLFVDEDAIAELNQRFLGKEGPTDVLAFPLDDEPSESGRSPDSGGTGPGFGSDGDEAPSLLGDVVICPTVAMRNAPEHAGTYEDELALLVVHGVLHLLGMDHLDDDEAEAMEARERELLSRHHRGGARPGAAAASGSTATGSTVPPAGVDPAASGSAAAAGATADLSGSTAAPQASGSGPGPQPSSSTGAGGAGSAPGADGPSSGAGATGPADAGPAGRGGDGGLPGVPAS